MSVINAHEGLRKDLANELKCVKENHDKRITQLEGIIEVHICISLESKHNYTRSGFILAYC